MWIISYRKRDTKECFKSDNDKVNVEVNDHVDIKTHVKGFNHTVFIEHDTFKEFLGRSFDVIALTRYHDNVVF